VIRRSLIALAFVLGASCAPPPPAKAVHLSKNQRVIHSHAGDKTVRLNRSIAISRADGMTIVGKLLSVDQGVVAIKTSKEKLFIAESEVLDAASY
jgi:hypothetical protein